MNIDSIYQSKYLKAADLGGRTIKVRISRVEMAELGQKDEGNKKIAIYFEGKQKGCVLNKTNASMIASAYGKNTDDWIGQEIELRPDRVTFQGQLVDSIRVQLIAPAADPNDELPPF